jgi:hypothetical protein
MRTFGDQTGLNRLRVLKLCSVGESHLSFSSLYHLGEPGIRPRHMTSAWNPQLVFLSVV